MSALPTELWESIASLCNKSDQARLCITSSRLLHIARPLLYQTVEVNFRYRHHGPHKFLVLLAHDKSLAKLVVELTLRSWNHVPPYIDFAVLACMVSLRRVKILGNVFSGAAQQNEFAKALSMGSGLPLEDLTWFGSLPGLEFQGIGNLTKVVWTDRGTSASCPRPMWDVLSRSQSTIRTICLPSRSLEEIPSHLRDVPFPHLLSLTIDFRWGISNPGRSNEHVGFILAHSDTLQELGLDYDNYEIGWSFDFYNALSRGLKPSSFPLLRSFRGDPKTFEFMVQERLECLGTTLQRLELRPIMQQRSSHRLELFQMEDVIVSSGCHFSVLKEIKLDMTSIPRHEVDKLVSLIQTCATICGRSLEVWKGTLPCFKMDANFIGDLFSPFEKLITLHLNLENIYDGNSFVNATVKTIASKCLSLREIVEDEEHTPRRWTIARGPVRTAKDEGLVCSVHLPAMY